MVLIFSHTGGKIHDQPFEAFHKILPCTIINIYYINFSL